MQTMNRFTLGATMLGLFAVGCEDRQELGLAPDAKTVAEAKQEPAKSETADASTPAPSETAITKIDGVTITVAPTQWPGEARIKEEVTPLLVTIQNQGERPVRVNYESFALISNEGRRYSALPPFQIEGEASERKKVPESEVVPEWDYQLFEPYDYFDQVYRPGTVTYHDEDDDVGREYRATYYTHWGEADLPTIEMLAKALPEGVVQPKGKVSGWLYFEELDGDIERVRFTADLIEAKNGRRFGEVSIPFEVDDAVPTQM